jgi:hypothetical protein
MSRPLVIACGALVSELRAVLAANGLTDAIDVRYLPANLHNRPERIVPTLVETLEPALADDPDRAVLVGYADCGTGGQLDALLAEHPNVRRLPGSHCYEFFTGSADFTALAGEELGTFFLTDYLAKHFEALIWQSYRLDRHPELRSMLFGNYTRVVLLTQSDDPAVIEAGRRAAEMLGLHFEHRHVGLAPFSDAVSVTLRKAV